MNRLHEPFGEQLKELCRDKFGGVPGFARKYDFSPQTLYSEFGNEPVSFSVPVLLAISSEFDLDPFALAQNRIVPHESAFANVPLIGSIAAGQPLEMIRARDARPVPMDVVDAYPNAFLLRVNGDSMNRVLPNGCYALVDPCVEVKEQGQPYVVSVGNTEATVKRVRVLNNGVELIPDSNDPTFKSKIYDFGDSEEGAIRIIGRVVWFCVPLGWRF